MNSHAIPLLILLAGALRSVAQSPSHSFDGNGNLTSQATTAAGPPVVITSPASQTATAGQRVTLTVVAGGAGLSFEWRKNGTPIGGAVTDTYTIASFAPGDEASYTVNVSNAAGSDLSDPAVIAFDSDSDGLSDAWELANFGTLSWTGSQDRDGDDRTNAEELADGTNPSDSGDSLVQLTIISTGGTVATSPSSSTMRFPKRTVINLTGLPPAGQEVIMWNGAVPTGPNQAAVTMDISDRTVEVQFGPVATPATLAAALDGTGLTFSTGGDVAWAGLNSAGATDGIDLATSAGAGRWNDSWIESVVTGPGAMSFQWRTSIHDADILALEVDGVRLGEATGETAWQLVHLAVPAGTHTVRWRWIRGDAVTELHANRVWLDAVLWSPGAVAPLAEAVDLTGYAVASGGDLPWDSFSSFQPLEVTGFDNDVIVGSADVPGASGSVWTAATSNDLGGAAQPVLREYAGLADGDYLAGNGLLTTPDGSFQLAPDSANNALRIGPLDTRTLTLVTPAPQHAVRLLAFSAESDAEIMVELEFTDGMRQSSVALVRHWELGTDISRKISVYSRTTGAEDADYHLHPIHVPVAVEHQQRSLRYITFRPSGATTAGLGIWVFAVSGASAAAGGAEDSAASGPVGLGDSSWLSASIPGGQAAGFQWFRPYYSTQSSLTLDGITIPSSSSGWFEHFFRTGPGNHVLKWRRTPDTGLITSPFKVARLSSSAAIPLPTALDDAALSWTTGGAAGWEGYALPAVAHDRSDLAASGAISAGGESWVQSEFDGPGTLSWRWKITAGIADRLELIVDSDTVHALTGVTAWEHCLHTFGSGHHTVRWRYVRPAGTAATAPDAAFLDEVAFESGTPPLEDAMDLAAGVHVFSRGDAVWTPQNTVTQDGTDAAAGGLINHSQISSLVLRVQGPRVVSWWRKVSTASGDGLQFLVDGNMITATVGNVDWVQQQYSLTAGMHDVEWLFVKNAGGIGFSDAVWVDRIVLSETPALAGALDAPGLTFTTGGAAPWTGTNLDAQTGTSSAVSGAIPHGMESWMQTTVTGPGTVSFQWMISAHTTDEIRFYVDGVQAAFRAGTGTDWQPVVRTLPAGNHTLRWSYVKDGATVAGSDLARVDTVAFTAENPPGLDNGIDAPELDLVSTGNEAFIYQTAETHDGVDAIQSGTVGDSESTSCSTQITGPGVLTFWWRVSSAGGDNFSYSIDGVAIASISGTPAWAQIVRQIPAGTHSLEWRYTKNGNTAAGSDAGWVDEVVFTPAGSLPLAAVLDGGGLSWVSGGSGSWAGAGAALSHDGSDAAYSGYLDINSSSWLETSVTGPGTFSFWWNASGSAGDIAAFSVNGELRHSEAGAPGWRQVVQTLGAGAHTLRFTYSKDATVPAAQDGLYLDEVNFAPSAPNPAPIAAAVENTRDFLTYQNAPWFVQNTAVHDGTAALQAGAIADSQESRLQMVVQGPGTLAFWWKVSSQSSADFLRLYVNAVNDSSISGTVDWTQVVRHLEPGENVIEWRYIKNANTVAGSDTGWLDRIEFAPAGGSLGSALDRVDLTWTTGGTIGTEAWMAQDISTAHDAVDAALSPPLAPGQQAWMETTVNGPGFLTFWWKMTGGTGDTLKVMANGEEQHALTGTVDWQQVGVAIPAGPQKFRWLWQRGAGARTLSQFAMVDEVSFTSQTPAELADAVDSTGMVFVTGGSALWGRQTGITHDGTDAAASGVITHSQETWMQTRLTGPGTLTFWRRVSSQAGSDLFHFLADGAVVAAHTASGEQAFALQTYTVAAGTHALRWRYSKNATTTTGSDMAWVDEVSFAPPATVPLDLGLDGAGLTWTTGGGSNWTGVASAAGAHDAVDYAVSGQPAAGAVSWLETSVTGPGTLTYWWRGGSSAPDDRMRLLMDGTTTLTEVAGSTAWLPVTATLPAGAHSLRWEFAPAGVAAASPGRVMQLDEVAFTPEAVPALLASAAPSGGSIPGVVSLVTSGTLPWSAQALVTHDGSSAPASGAITHSQDTWIEAIIDGPGEGAAWWNVNSQAADLHRLSIDGVNLAAIGGVTALWERPSFYLGAGRHRVRWQYVKDAVTTTAPDKAYMDELVWNPGAVNSIGAALGLPSQTLLTQGVQPWNTQTAVTKDGVSALASGVITHNQQSSVTFTSNGPGWISYWWKVDSQVSNDLLRHFEDGVQRHVISGAVDWTHVLRRSAAGTHTQEWRYSKNATTTTGADMGWLDEVEFAAPGDLNTALDGAGLTWTTGGDAPWAGYALEYSADGSDSASSGGIPDGGVSWLQTSVTGPGTLSFASKVLAHSSDLFTLSVDGGTPEVLDAVTWTTSQRVLGGGPHTLRWAYTKSAATVTEPDSAWLDQVSWTPGTPPLADAADLTGGQFSNSGPALWFAQTATAYDGSDALQAGAVDHSQITRLTMPVTGPAVLSFWWKVSSASGDNLSWLLDGVQQDVMSGEINWERQYTLIPPGVHTIEWRYAKNASVVAGSDTGWVDRIEVAYANANLAEALDAPGLTFSTGGAQPWSALSLSMAHDGTDQAVSGAVPTGGETWVETTVTGPGTLSFWQKTSTHASEPVFFTLNGSVWRSTAGEVDWQQTIVDLPAGTHTARWTWFNDTASVSGEDAVWLDSVQFTPAVSPPFAAALNYNPGTWLTTDPQWTVSGAAESHDGISALASGTITHSQSTSIFSRVEGPAWLSFWWNVSSQATSDTLACYVDGTAVTSISGESGWRPVLLPVRPGTHTVEWRYAKNASVSSGADRGWIDQVTLTPGLPLGPALDSPALTWTTAGVESWSGIAYAGAGHDGTDAAAVALSDAGQSSRLETSVSGPGTFSFWWLISSPDPQDELRFSVDGIQYETLTSGTAWRRVVCWLPAGAHTLRWESLRDVTATTTLLNQALVDEVVWTPGDPAGYGDGLDYPAMALVSTSTAGAGPWQFETVNTMEGGDSLRSGPTPPSGLSRIAGIHRGPGFVSFSLSNSGGNSDVLRFYVDGVLDRSSSGVVPWTTEVQRIGDGDHRLEWTWTRSSAAAAGSDAALIDNFTVSSPVPLQQGADAPSLTFTTGGHVPWSGWQFSPLAHDGQDFIASGTPSQGQSSWLETTVTGPGTLNFWWHGDSDAQATISVDGKKWLYGSYANGWLPVSLSFPPGAHTVRWSMDRGQTSATGDDFVRLDEVTWIPGDPAGLGAALDQPGLTFASIGSSGTWFNQSADSADGVSAARAGVTPDSGKSSLFTLINGPLLMYHDYRVSAAAGDRLRGYLNGGEVLNSSNIPTWEKFAQRFDSGEHLFEWSYQKNSTSTSGMDTAWVDRVTTVAPGPVQPGLEGTGLTFTTGGDSPWVGYAAPGLSHDGSDFAGSGRLATASAVSWLETSVTGPGTLSFWYRVPSPLDLRATILIDGKPWLDGDEAGIWTPVAIALNAGPHTVRWVAGRNAVDPDGFGGVMLDEVVWLPQANPPLFTAFDIPVSPVVTVGGNFWTSQSTYALDANGALENGPLGDTGFTRLYTEITGPGRLHVNYHRDWLYAYLSISDNFFNLPESAPEWLPLVVQLSPGTHRMEIYVAGDLSGPPSSGFRFDKVGFGNPTPVTLPVALDTSGLTWTTDPVAPWQGVSGSFAYARDGIDCAESPLGADSWLETTVTGPGVIQFDWRIVPGFGSNLSFFVDGDEIIELNVDGRWITESIPISAGTHILRWQHYDYGTSSPSGVDRVSFSTGMSFADWQALHFNPAELANPVISGFTADPDADGLSNGVESMLGTSPRLPGGEPLTASIDTSGPTPEWIIRFVVPASAPIDVTSHLQISTDFASGWTDAARGSVNAWIPVAPATVSESPLPGGYRVISVMVPATGNRIGARLLVEQP